MSQTSALSRWSVASPLAGGAFHAVGSGLFHTLIPLRLVANGHGADAVGLVVMAEGIGFLIGCMGSVRLIRSVGEIRAYAAFAALSAVLLLTLAAGPQLGVMMAILFLVGFADAGQSVVIESWLNAMVSNTGRGRLLTLYVLVLGLFYGLGQLLARDIDPAGDTMLMISSGFFVMALVPVTAIWVGEPQLHAPVGVHFIRTLRTSPLGTLACLLTGLVASTFSSIGLLYGLEIGFSQDRIVLLMAAVALGGLFLQFPIGYLSDRLDRRKLMIWLALTLAAVCCLFLVIEASTPFWILLALFSVFGGISEIFYPLGVAHANDRASPSQFVSLSSNLLLLWALGGAIGPPVAAFGVEHFGARSFFWYAIALLLGFAAFAIWRRHRLPEKETQEGFVVYPPTSPIVYELVSPRESGESRGHGR